ncbi:MAG TPA: hypothetical protein VGM37_12700 [Armatimonadota bacterium]|jgi:hypothetical protein
MDNQNEIPDSCDNPSAPPTARSANMREVGAQAVDECVSRSVVWRQSEALLANY